MHTLIQSNRQATDSGRALLADFAQESKASSGVKEEGRSGLLQHLDHIEEQDADEVREFSPPTVLCTSTDDVTLQEQRFQETEPSATSSAFQRQNQIQTCILVNQRVRTLS